MAALIFIPVGIFIAFKMMDFYRATEGSEAAKDAAISKVADRLDRMFTKK